MHATDSFLLRLLLLLLLCQLGCASEPTLLNSERIARKYGNYQLELIENKNYLRVSNLYSQGPEGHVCRTFAVVRFADPGDPRYREEHALIVAGASIGTVFRQRGWEIDKRHVYIANLPVAADAVKLARLMRIDIPATLAIHVYVFRVTRSGESADYATIAEIHHPDYLSTAELKSIYGGTFSAPADAEEVRETLALVGLKIRHAGE